MRRKKIIFIFSLVVIVIAIALISYILIHFSFFTHSANRVTATVVRVIDGDTIELANGNKVRLLGIDAPERGSYYYEEVKQRLEQLIKGKTVALERDVNNKDNFNRLLRYVFVDGVFVNLKLVEEGCAYAYVVAPDEKYINELIEAEGKARRQRILIWESSTHSNCISASVHYNARGDDRENLNDEYISFKNLCESPIDMTNWLVKDESANNHTLPKFVLLSGHIVTLYSGIGIDTAAKLYWNSERPIWNNAGDTLYLRDANGKLILKQSYGKN